MNSRTNKNRYKISETEGTGFSYSESEGTGMSFSETEGTGISNKLYKISSVVKFSLFCCLLVSNFSLANSIHLFSQANDNDVVNGVIHDSEKNEIYRISGYLEGQNFVGLMEQNKSSDDGTGDKSSDDGTGGKSSDDGTGGKSSDDGTGGSKSSVFTLNLNCESNLNRFIRIESMNENKTLPVEHFYINGSNASCTQTFELVSKKPTN